MASHKQDNYVYAVWPSGGYELVLNSWEVGIPDEAFSIAQGAECSIVAIRSSISTRGWRLHGIYYILPKSSELNGLSSTFIEYSAVQTSWPLWSTAVFT